MYAKNNKQKIDMIIFNILITFYKILVHLDQYNCHVPVPLII